MGNLGAREKYAFILLGIVVVVFLIYFFGIRSLGTKHDELVAQRNQLQAQIDYYNSLISQNAATQTQIEEIKAQISEAEGYFLPALNSEALEQYVLKTFEDEGCPYLVNVSVENLSASSVTLPDGTAAEDTLLGRRVVVQYSGTDGYNIPEYNMSANVMTSVGGEIDEAAFNDYLDQMYWHGADSREGYDGFVSAIKVLESADPDCIKVNSVGITSEGGYLVFSASIDFYSASFTNRVSEPDMSAPYITWAGETNIDTDGGLLGLPLMVENPDSAFYGMVMPGSEAASASRPFATYYSNAIFQMDIQERGLSELLGVEGVQVPAAAEADVVDAEV